MSDPHDHPHSHHDHTDPAPAPIEDRPASVTLRGTSAADARAAALDEANRSLAEALRVTFRLLQVAMVVLAALYALSGFQSIKSDERGIRVVFGEATATDLPPGFQFSWPYPVGEMIKVNTGTQEARLNREFWPYVAVGKEDSTTIDQLSRTMKLNPDQDGALLTGDGNLAHTKWKVVYTRAEPFSYAQNVFTPDEDRIVRAAVRRGVVRAVAEITIDQLLKQSQSEDASVASRARLIAQDTLDELGAGIRVERLTLDGEVIPPVAVRSQFAGVQAAASRAGQAVTAAEQQAQTTLNFVAGLAAPDILSQMDLYERQLAEGDRDAAAVTLERIHAIMEGRPVDLSDVGGRVVEAQISGEVARLLNEATQYRAEAVNTARSDLALFTAKLEQFRSNPEVMIQTEWADAFSMFLAQESVSAFTLPPGLMQVRLQINPDPDIQNEQVVADRRRRAEDAREQREREQQQQRFRTQEGVRLDAN